MMEGVWHKTNTLLLCKRPSSKSLVLNVYEMFFLHLFYGAAKVFCVSLAHCWGSRWVLGVC